MEQETKKCPYCGEEILNVAKKCKHCGEWLNKEEEHEEKKNMIPCPICGEMIEEGITQCPYCHESLVEKSVNMPLFEVKSNSMQSSQTRGYFDYYFVEPFIKHYFKFKGRINRKHYWISMLSWCIFTPLIMFASMDYTDNPNVPQFIQFLYCLIPMVWFFGSIIPIWAANCRRMRDGDSELSMWAWWAYITFSPFLLWWLVKPSDNIMRDDGLAPDITPKLAFKKSDKITLVCIILFFILSSCLSSLYEGNGEQNNTQIEKQENVNPAKLPDIRVSEPYVQEQSDEHVNIKAVIVNDNYTIVSFQIVPNEDETWITIDENTYIEANNKRLKMIDASGIPISPEKMYGLSVGEIVTFYLTFPPIPKDTKEINIIEEDAWWWRGIQLK